MSDSLPAPLEDSIEQGIKIVKDNKTQQYFEYNIYKTDVSPVPICGVILSSGGRCRNKDGTCGHQEIIKAQEKKIKESSGGMISVLKTLSDNSLMELGMEFSYLLNIADSIDANDLDDLDIDLKFQYALLFKTVNEINSDEVAISKSARNEANNILKNIIKMKEVKSKIRDERKIDPSHMREFIMEIFTVAKKVLPKEYYDKFAQAIADEVVAPRNVVRVSGLKKNSNVQDAVVVPNEQ